MNTTETMEPGRHDDGLRLLEDIFPSPGEVPAEFRPDSDSYTPCYLIDGEVRVWKGPLAPVESAIYLKNDDVVERAVIGRVPAMSEQASLAALDAATKAWDSGRGVWPSMGPEARIGAVEAFTAELSKTKEEIVRLLMWEIGKSLEESRAEVDRTIDYIASTIEALKVRCSGQSTRGAGSLTARTTDAPLGVCLVMGPYNNPIYETYTMLIPALLIGNAAVVKAPRFGVLPHQLLFPALAGHFPPGVVNFIYGGEDGEDNAGSIMGTGQIDCFSFIGSPAGAAALISQHPRPLRLRTILSLGAKNAALVTADADVETAVRECVLGSLAFDGQRCTALKILFVHESMCDEFLARLSRAVDELPIGMPWKKGVKITPLPYPGKVDEMAAYVKDAVQKGAVVANRGGKSSHTLFQPAVVFPVSRNARLYREEQFGPVVPVCPYRSEEEFLEFLASCEYGQQVSLFSREPDEIARWVPRLRSLVGRININCKCQRGPDFLPFSGRGDSGMTTLSVDDTLKAFSMPVVVAARRSENDGEAPGRRP